MKVYNSSSKRYLYFMYRLVSQVVDPIILVTGILNYPRFIKDLFVYKQKIKKKNNVKINFTDLYPQLHDKKSLTPFDSQYFYFQVWAFEKILENKPFEHVDVGSPYTFVGMLSRFVKTTFVDIRPIDTKLENLEIVKGDILALPFETDSLSSISCLHVIEHIGLGRYGDNINSLGSIQACKQLSSVLSVGGHLYIAVPIGKEDKVCFNAHRVFKSSTIVDMFKNLKLVEFSFVDDSGQLIRSVKLEDASNVNYGCGMYVFTKENKE